MKSYLVVEVQINIRIKAKSVPIEDQHIASHAKPSLGSRYGARLARYIIRRVEDSHYSSPGQTMRVLSSSCVGKLIRTPLFLPW